MLSFLILIVLTSGGYLSLLQKDSQPAPRWLLDILIALGVLAAAAGIIMRRQEMALGAFPMMCGRGLWRWSALVTRCSRQSGSS
jgi:hypothetical protein